MSNIEAGSYVGKAVPGSLQVGEANNGSPQVGCRIDILNEGYEGEQVTFYGSLNGGAIPITLRMLRDLGWAGDSLDDQTGLGDVEARIRVYYEDYQGEQKQKVQVSGGQFMKKPLEGGALAALNARLKGEIAKSKAGKGGTAKPAGWAPPPRQAPGQWDGQGAEPKGDDDKIPF